MNRESSLFQEISLETARGLIQNAFHTDCVSQMELLDGGLFNTTYKVAYGEEGKKAVLRLGPVNRHLLLSFERHLMDSENEVYKLLEKQGVPCPKVLYLDTSKKRIDRDYMFTEYVESVCMSKTELTEENRGILQFEAGRQTARMHGVHFSTFGFVHSALRGEGNASWYGFLEGLINDILTRAEPFSVFGEEGSERILKAFEANRELLEEIGQPHLIHCDLWEGNILLKKAGDRYKLALIIDGDRALFGDPDFEFASGWMISERFLEGYGVCIADYRLPKRERRRKVYHMIYEMINAYVWLAEYNQTEPSSRCGKNALEEAEALGMA